MKMDKNIPQAWLKQAPIALSVSVMLEGWIDDAAPGIGPMGNPLRAGTLDLQGRSWADYGPNAGAWRILDLLQRHNVKAVFYTSGIIAERYPQLMQEIAGAGHNVAAHSWTQNMIPAYLDAHEEAQDIERCTLAIERTTGQRPIGWLSPRCTPSADTSRLLAAAGYSWHADIFDRDVPYPLTTSSGTLLAMPFTMEVNDMPLYVRYGNEPQAYTRVLKRIVENWQRVGATPVCLDLTVHAHVFGRPAGAVELLDCLEFLQQRKDAAWLTNHAELAGLYCAG
jgi:peptidoglycan/xylan/chitin deacetylase (PgdA/CDA1 family)